MRVVILGAGFSKEAGYPLGNELLEEIAEEQRNSMFIGEADRWKAFETWHEEQKNINPALNELLATGNPEYLLTYLDIACMSVKTRENQLWDAAFAAERNGQDIRELRRECEEYGLHEFEEKSHRKTLSDALWHYFGRRHYLDYEKESIWADGAILNFFKEQLSDGDVVLTFNYDAIAERCLYALGRWHPTDGYESPIQLTLNSLPAEPAQSLSSTVKVLKLHGSVGWKKDKNHIYLDRTFLNYLRIYHGEDPSTFAARIMAENAMVLPSFIKPLSDPILIKIWAEAAVALKAASEIIIIGYSLPEADQAASMLLATTLYGRDCRVVLINPDKAHPLADSVYSRYEKTIGRQPIFFRKTFSEWMQMGCPVE